MNHDAAAALRDELNALDYVRAPDDDAGNDLFRLVRVNQPGYLNGEPFYEVVMTIVSPVSEAWHVPADVLELVVDRGCYIRVDGEELHVRDMEAGDAE